MIQSVKVKNLSLSKDNVRKRNRDLRFDELCDSIAAQGLLQNLIVTPLKKAGHFTVKAGGRRLRALQHLITQGTLPADHEVSVLVLTDEETSVEASLTENFQRVPMNPADECTAFNYLIQKGMTAEDVAKRQGVTTRFVEQRVRLAELAEPIFDALASGEISLGTAQAYAVTADTDRQAHVFRQMQNSYYGNNPENIKRAILNGTTKASDATARYVGREAYLAAGGRIDADLFAEAGDENWIDGHVIEQLAQAKLEAAAAQVAASQGLAFVTPVIATRVPYDLERQYHDYHPTERPATEEEETRLQTLAEESDALVAELESVLVDGTPEADTANARLEAIEAEVDAIDTARRTIDPAVKGQLGTFVYIGPDGETRVLGRYFSEKPIVDPNARKPVEAGDDTGEAVDIGPRMSAALTEELATQRRQILVAHLASDPALALDLTIFLMAQKIVFSSSFLSTHSTLSAAPAQFPLYAFRDEGSLASEAIEEQRQALDRSWAGYPTTSQRFDAFRKLGEDARGAWIAYAIARTLEPTLNVPEGGRHNGFHDHLGRLLGIDVASWWRPTAENYFGRVKKDMMLTALEEIGGPALRARYKDAKKGDLAKSCAALCDGQGIIEAEVREKARTWLPNAMCFEAADTPDRHLHLDIGDDEDLGDDDSGGDTGEDFAGEAETAANDAEGEQPLDQAA